MSYAELGLKGVATLPGVVDLKPLMCRAKFAQALIAEERGDKAKAAQLLDEAVAIEAR